MDAALSNPVERAGLGHGVLVPSGADILRARCRVLPGNHSHAEDSAVSRSGDWPGQIRRAAGIRRPGAAGAGSERSRTRHLLVRRQSCFLHVLVHLVPRDVPALPLRPAHEGGLESTAADGLGRADCHRALGPDAATVGCDHGGVAMSLTPLLRKIFLVDLVKGLKVTFRYQPPSEAITEQYPLERPVI